jgi:hypothetical protein
MSAHRSHIGKVVGGIFSLGLLFGPSGCAVPTHIKSLNPEVPKVGISAAVDGGVEKLSDPATAKRVQGLLASQGIRDIEKELIDGIASAAEASLSDKDRLARLKEGSGELVSGITRGALRGAVTEASSEEFQRELKNAIASLVTASSEALVQSVRDAELGKKGATAIREDVGPAVRDALKEDVAPAMSAVLQDEKVLHALSETARAIGHGAVVGATDAVTEAQKEKNASDDSSFLSRVGAVASKGVQLAGSIAWVLGLAVVLLIVWVIKLAVQTKRLREEGMRRAASAQLLSEGMKLAEGKPWSDDFMRSLQARIAAEEAALEELRKERSKHGWRWRSPGPHAGGSVRPSLA